MTEQELIEQLADKEHASWARWMDYLLSCCEGTPLGSAIIPSGLVERWKRQIETPYADLSEQEKQSDRNEVAHILPIITEYEGSVEDIPDLTEPLAKRLNFEPVTMRFEWEGRIYVGTAYYVEDAKQQASDMIVQATAKLEVSRHSLAEMRNKRDEPI